jgi:hypothetical protein
VFGGDGRIWDKSQIRPSEDVWTVPWRSLGGNNFRGAQAAGANLDYRLELFALDYNRTISDISGRKYERE